METEAADNFEGFPGEMLTLAQVNAMQQLKTAINFEPLLCRPKCTQPFILMTEWSQAGVRAVLSQLGEKGQEELQLSRKSYSDDGECLAAAWEAYQFRHYIGTSFILTKI